MRIFSSMWSLFGKKDAWFMRHVEDSISLPSDSSRMSALAFRDDNHRRPAAQGAFVFTDAAADA
jgi:predicted nucleotide-binding protein